MKHIALPAASNPFLATLLAISPEPAPAAPNGAAKGGFAALLDQVASPQQVDGPLGDKPAPLPPQAPPQALAAAPGKIPPPALPTGTILPPDAAEHEPSGAEQEPVAAEASDQPDTIIPPLWLPTGLAPDLPVQRPATPARMAPAAAVSAAQPATALPLRPAVDPIRPAPRQTAMGKSPAGPPPPIAQPVPVTLAPEPARVTPQSESAPVGQLRQPAFHAEAMPVPGPDEPGAPFQPPMVEVASAPTLPDLTQLLDRLTAARAAMAPAETRLEVQHAEFGPLTLTVGQDESGRLAVELSAPDADTRQALATALLQAEAPADAVQPVDRSEQAAAANTGNPGENRNGQPSARDRWARPAQQQPGTRQPRGDGEGEGQTRSGTYA